MTCPEPRAPVESCVGRWYLCVYERRLHGESVQRAGDCGANDAGLHLSRGSALTRLLCRGTVAKSGVCVADLAAASRASLENIHRKGPTRQNGSAEDCLTSGQRVESEVKPVPPQASYRPAGKHRLSS